MRWLTEVEGAFLTSSCPENRKVTLARSLLKENAGDLWGVRTSGMTAAQVAAITWPMFVEWFTAEFVPRVEVELISNEFQNLKQTTETLAVMNKKFIEMARFCPMYEANGEMKKTRYLGMLRDDIREFVGTTHYPTLADMMEAARRRELFLTTLVKGRNPWRLCLLNLTATRRVGTILGVMRRRESPRRVIPRKELVERDALDVVTRGIVSRTVLSEKRQSG